MSGCVSNSIAIARQAAQNSMIDICDIELVADTPIDSPLPDSPSGTVIANNSCGYDIWKTERIANEIREEVYGIKVRLPFSVEGNVQNFAKITIKTKAGEPLELQQAYSIVGKPKIGVTAIVCYCLQEHGATAI